MNLLHPPLLSALARDYALGTLTGRGRRRFERLLSESPVARAELVRWQEHFAKLSTAVPPMKPREQVWLSLVRRLGLQSVPPTPPASAWRRLFGARALGGLAVGAMAGVLGSTVLLQSNPGWLGLEPVRESLPASYVGLLSNAAGEPVVLLSARRYGRVLTAKLLKALPPLPDKVGLLWAFPRDGGAPFLVGALPSQGSGELPLLQAAEKLFFTVDRLGVSFEPIGSTPTKPSGSMVVAGPCVKLW